jgi:predicted metal-binding protein
VELLPVTDGPAVVACNSCRHPAAARDGAGAVPRRSGALLVDALRDVQARDPAFAGIAVQEMPCLFACDRACTVHLRAPGKIGYVLGGFAPDGDAATGIMTFMRHYADSATGQVPYALWPAAVKGHFIVRVPPAGQVVA